MGELREQAILPCIEGSVLCVRAHEAAVALTPADGGRRSRRGFAYQDAVTLLDCLDMLEGQWTAVSWEDLEDILCHRDGAPVYRQVKTIEEVGTRHSIANVCRPEEKKAADSSYLGKLFLGKPLPDGTRFTFIVNETPQRDLYEFVAERDRPRGPVSADARVDIVQRLRGVQLPDGRDSGWCVDRVDVLVEARTIDQVEAEAMARLAPLVEACLGEKPPRCGPRRQRAQSNPATARRFHRTVDETQAQAAGCRNTGARGGSPARCHPRLPSDLPRQCRYPAPRVRRSSRSDQRHLHAHDGETTRRTSRRRLGGVLETLVAVSELPEVTSRQFTLAEAHAVLSGITARCQNRYADAS
ncbi:dsDNA nuclease domain-containing protein [Streptomyces acidicola]|uniref:dsDNA nuclease domain-containing protein n=1 Tax=Streptomyces acidicola TaxID=2596892 RepID=UPI0034384E37